MTHPRKSFAKVTRSRLVTLGFLSFSRFFFFLFLPRDDSPNLLSLPARIAGPSLFVREQR